jgi:hypothetical protein
MCPLSTIFGFDTLVAFSHFGHGRLASKSLSQQVANQSQMQEVMQLLRKYFDALYDGDPEIFSEIFHPNARLFSAAEDGFLIMDFSQYLERVRGRASPASRGDRRADEILSITIATPTTAHARVRELLLPKHFTDELTLVCSHGRWQIVSKVWHYELVAS